jgi:oxygen-independent coproporphyrinogen-3 oxidase
MIPAYVEALWEEIEAAPPVHARSIYFGGGTPSLLPLDQVAQLLRALRHAFHGLPPEITLEANPGTLNLSYLQGLHELGVNRISLGVQSAHDDELRLLGRLHDWADALRAMEDARQAGFDNLSLDLIYGLPGQNLDRWRRTLRAALDLQVDHLSLYCLTLEESTPLARRIAAGELPPPDSDRAADMYQEAEEVLARAGFFHYEISNWARIPQDSHNPISAADRPCAWWPGGKRMSERFSPFVCAHNLTYWRNQPYLGFGAGASSWWRGRRWTNTRLPTEYISRLERGQRVTTEEEEINPRLEMGETMMMGLRLAEGVTDRRFNSRFGVGLEAAFAQELSQLKGLGLIAWDGRVVRLTARGRLLGNQVFLRFLP